MIMKSPDEPKGGEKGWWMAQTKMNGGGGWGKERKRKRGRNGGYGNWTTLQKGGDKKEGGGKKKVRTVWKKKSLRALSGPHICHALRLWGAVGEKKTGA